MYKIYLKRFVLPPGRTKKIIRVMKLVTLFLMTAILQVSANTYAQKVTLSEKNAPLTRIFNLIREQSGYDFLVTNSVLSNTRPVTIQVTNADIKEVLDQIFANQPLEYEISNQSVLVREKSPSLLNQIKTALNIPLTITGKVLDETGQPLPGVTVRQKGTNNITTTDGKGVFSIGVPDDRTLIVFTFIGYEGQELQAKDIPAGSVIHLKAGVNNLQEVVINKGYYNEKRALSTGNVSVVSAKEIGEQPVTDPILALEGRVPGLYINQSSGIAGANNTIRIRGQNSIANGNDPLYMVDGVPFGSTSLTNGLIGGGALDWGAVGSNTNSATGMSPFNALNPSDIESIEVLKDADATAIYGSRGANGVILITTKKGKAGQTKVDIDVYSGAGQVTRTMDLLNTPQYLEMRHEALKNDGYASLLTDPTYDVYWPDLKTWDTTRYTNWQKVLIGKPALFTNAQGSLSGGSANTQFMISGGYSKQGTPFPGDYSDRKASAHFNLTHTSNDQRFQAVFTASYVNDNSDLPGVDLTQFITLAPDAPALYDAAGNLNWQPQGGTATWANPLAYTLQHANALSNNLVSSLNLRYEILPGLQLKSNFGYNHNQMDQTILTLANSSAPPYNTDPNRRSNNFASTQAQSWIIEPQLSYSRKLGRGQLDALLGTSFQSTSQSSTGFRTYGFGSDALITNPSAASSVTLAGSSASLYRYTSIYGRIGYNWEEKYLVNVTARRDGSSRFGPGKQFGDFGAIGAGWVFSKEKFIADALPFLSFGKLRASYGITGNDQIGDYQFLSTYYAYGGVAYQGVAPLAPTALTNPYFAWEVNKKLEGGLELGFFKDRVSLSASYYRNRSGNQLVGYPTPFITGFSSVQANLPATVQNSGWEFSLNTVNVRSGSFTWSSSANLTLPQNKLLSYPGLENSPYAYQYAVGQSIFSKEYYHSTGVNPQTGVYSFATSNANGVPSFPGDYVFRTKPITASFYGGLGNSFSYRGIHLDVFIQFTKQLGLNYLRYFAKSPGAFNLNEPVYVLTRWQQPGDNSNIQKFSLNTYNAYQTLLASDAAISDASYIRLKNVALSYDLPEQWYKAMRLKNARIYLQCQNLFTITGYKGLDPENQGLTLPPLRMITAGIKLGL